jgi:peptidoglycan/xylan/chitin deacetylase (PgdA/CDA1 family)
MSIKHSFLEFSYRPLRLYKSVLTKASSHKGGRLRVLLYHDIAPTEKEKFSSQLRWLSRFWRFISPMDFSAMLSGELPVTEDSLLLTFDDGFYSNREIAETVLNPMGIKAIFFIISQFSSLSDSSEWRDFVSRNICPGLSLEKVPANWRNMGISDLTYLLETGHTIGAHTASHARLSTTPEERLVEEVVTSANYLEEKLGYKIKHFAYTFGDLESFSPSALKVARSRVDFIHTGLRGFNTTSTPPWAIRRDSIDPKNSLSLVGAFLEGGADPIYRSDLAALESWGDMN